MCLLANKSLVLSSQNYLGINLQAANTVFQKTPLPCHARGAACTNAHAQISGTRVLKSFHEMKGIGMVNQQKGVQQDTVYSAVVVMYPRLFDPKGVIET